MSDVGYGYTSAPTISITPTILDNPDVLYAIWQGEITHDTSAENIVDIDIDDTETWVERPTDPLISLVFPTTTVIDYTLPNAGYVNFNDVVHSSFDIANTISKWGTTAFNPTIDDTLWVAKTFTEDWGVYKLTDTVVTSWNVVGDAADNLLLLLPVGETITPQLATSGTDFTDLGNMLCLQTITGSVVDATKNYAIMFSANGEYVHTDSITYNSYSLVDINGIPLTVTDIGTYAEFTNLLMFKSMRFSTAPISVPSHIVSGDKVWVDNPTGKWNVSTYNGIVFTKYREQEALINTSLFENAQIFYRVVETRISQLPVYDPFKGILPGTAKQNISYMLLRDPARYNVSADTRLYSPNIIFGEQQVGKLWWDLSDVRYVYYEQPIAIDETPTDSLLYRRQYWGSIMPGSAISIYEWTKSSVPPADYVGAGTPKSTTEYVQLITTNKFTNISEIHYYFWVKNSTTKPNIENRTMTATDVAGMLLSPKSQNFSYFTPIQQTANNNSYMFYNATEILSYQGNNVSVNYYLTDRDDQKHTQWSFIRENDTRSFVADRFWNKMVDSLCGYTKELPISNEWSDSIEYNGKEVLPVPATTLGEDERYGIDYRPRQTMFVKLQTARKIFVQSANALLQHLPIYDLNANWATDVGLTTNAYWKYTTWYLTGFENVTPTKVFATQNDADAALLSNLLRTGDIVEVTAGTSRGYILYNVQEISTTSSTQSWQKVGEELGAIALLDTIYTTNNVYALSVELRLILSALRTTVFVNKYIVDQNILFVAMINYVMSEQNHPDWVFKSSYIYIKENNMPLSQDAWYISDQITNIIDYITDVKPYHTQIRDYTSTNTVTDIAECLVSDTTKFKITVAMGPSYSEPLAPGVWDADGFTPGIPAGVWDAIAWDIIPTPGYTYDTTPAPATANDRSTDSIKWIKVITKLPVLRQDNRYYPLAPYNETVSDVDPLMSAAVNAWLLTSPGGSYGTGWFANYDATRVGTVEILPVCITYVQAVSSNGTRTYYRNSITGDAFSYAGTDTTLWNTAGDIVGSLDTLDWDTDDWDVYIDTAGGLWYSATPEAEFLKASPTIL
jgi:hypothetical protein